LLSFQQQGPSSILVVVLQVLQVLVVVLVQLVQTETGMHQTRPGRRLGWIALRLGGRMLLLLTGSSRRMPDVQLPSELI
jgi:hypothetical protein